MKSKLILSALVLCASSTVFANPNPIPKNAEGGAQMPPEMHQQRHIGRDLAMAMNKKHEFEVKGPVAQEYIELGKLQELNRHLAKDIIDVNIAMANQCGEVMPWKELVEKSAFRSYTSSRPHMPEHGPDKGYENCPKHELAKHNPHLDKNIQDGPKMEFGESLTSVAATLCRGLHPQTMPNFEMKN